MISLRTGYNIAHDTYDVFLVIVDLDGRITHVAQPLTMVPVSPGGWPHDPTLRLGTREASKIAGEAMEALSQRGIKPASQATLEGELKATREHLDDMRRMAFSAVTPVALIPKDLVKTTETA